MCTCEACKQGELPICEGCREEPAVGWAYTYLKCRNTQKKTSLCKECAVNEDISLPPADACPFEYLEE